MCVDWHLEIPPNLSSLVKIAFASVLEKIFFYGKSVSPGTHEITRCCLLLAVGSTAENPGWQLERH